MTAPDASVPSRVCPKCGGERVDVRIGGSAELVLARFSLRDRLRKGLRGAAGVVAVACTTCGWIELYTSEPQKLK